MWLLALANIVDGLEDLGVAAPLEGELDLRNLAKDRESCFAGYLQCAPVLANRIVEPLLGLGDRQGTDHLWKIAIAGGAHEKPQALSALHLALPPQPWALAAAHRIRLRDQCLRHWPAGAAGTAHLDFGKVAGAAFVQPQRW